jgi:hypothetical protein
MRLALRTVDGACNPLLGGINQRPPIAQLLQFQALLGVNFSSLGDLLPDGWAGQRLLDQG